MDVESFKRLPIMGIVRGIEADALEPLTRTVLSSGLRTVEITMNTPGAPGLIKKMVSLAEGRLTIGAGTVLTNGDLSSALDAGATFIVLPTFIPEIVEYCSTRSIPVFPGAFTPQEIYGAWSAGATMVKVFPVKFFGPEYIKEVKAPFQDIDMLACGGIRPENIRSYFSCGAAAVAFGSSIFNKEWMAKREFSRIEERIRSLISAVA